MARPMIGSLRCARETRDAEKEVDQIEGSDGRDIVAAVTLLSGCRPVRGMIAEDDRV